RERVQRVEVEVPAVVVGLAAVEPRRFQFHLPRVKRGGSDAEADVRGILPVMRQRRKRVAVGGRAVHEGRRPERRLADWREVQLRPEPTGEWTTVRERRFQDAVVWVL